MATSTSSGSGPTRYFILIGINDYPPGNLSIPEFEDLEILNGCVRDVEQLYTVLKSKFPISATKSHYQVLTSPVIDIQTSLGEKSVLPSWGAMVGAMKLVQRLAVAGDVVTIHYSGHGGKLDTIYPDLKEGEKLDEVLLPYDFRQSGEFLRDVEIAALLAFMVDKRLKVTFILDACNSGGISRGASGEILAGGRGINMSGAILPSGFVKKPKLEQATSVDRKAEWLKKIKAYAAGHTRKTWLLEPVGFEMVSACQENQKATESGFMDDDGVVRKHGTFTRLLCDTLKEDGAAEVTHGTLYRRLWHLVQRKHAHQTPVFVGDESRLLFSSATKADIPGITVREDRPMINDEFVRMLYLEAGLLHGVTKDSWFGIYKWSTMDMVDKNRLCLVKVAKVDNVMSELEFIDEDGKKLLEGAPDWEALRVIGRSCLAVLYKLSISNKIKLLVPADVKAMMSSAEYTELESEARHSLFAALATDENDTPNYILHRDSSPPHHFAIHKPKKTRLDSPLQGFPDTRRLFRALTHLAQFESTLHKIRNPTPPAEFRNAQGQSQKFSVALSSGDGTITRDEQDGSYILPIVTNARPRKLVLTVTSTSTAAVEVAVLAFYCPFRILNFFPRRHLGRLLPDSTLFIPFEIDSILLDATKKHAVLFKVFFTNKMQNFRLLELGPPDGEIEGGGGVTRGPDAFVELVERLTMGLRGGDEVLPDSGWLVEHVKVKAAEAEVKAEENGEKEEEDECPLYRYQCQPPPPPTIV